jgi:hypothetical protein
VPVVARIPLPSRSGLQQGGWFDEESAVATTSGAMWVADGCAVARIDPRTNRIITRVATIGERARRATSAGCSA